MYNVGTTGPNLNIVGANIVQKGMDITTSVLDTAMGVVEPKVAAEIRMREESNRKMRAEQNLWQELYRRETHLSTIAKNAHETRMAVLANMRVR